jgi:hypothetical protein
VTVVVVEPMELGEESDANEETPTANGVEPTAVSEWPGVAKRSPTRGRIDAEAGNASTANRVETRDVVARSLTGPREDPALSPRPARSPPGAPS